ncbi:MAG TPA: hypothetical protein VFG83_12010 [Kofleriaceae bacterium]|nr:hypothetical protein [Kofleriaceae bacterium]
MKSRLSFVLLMVCAAACGGQVHTIAGTSIPESPQNRAIIDTIEAYRLAVERRDAAALVLMASPDYWEDSGTSTGADDYGYKKLHTVLASRLQQAEDIRYSLHYVKIARRDNAAYVDVLIDASFTIRDATGRASRQDLRDQNQLVLTWNGQEWKFLSGM